MAGAERNDITADGSHLLAASSSVASSSSSSSSAAAAAASSSSPPDGPRAPALDDAPTPALNSSALQPPARPPAQTPAQTTPAALALALALTNSTSTSNSTSASSTVSSSPSTSSAADPDADPDAAAAAAAAAAAITTAMPDGTEPPSRSHTPAETPEQARYRRDLLVPSVSVTAAQGEGPAQALQRHRLEVVGARSPGPLPDSSAYFDTTSIEPSSLPDETVSEEAIRAHFRDVESSFMPALSPVPTGSSSPSPSPNLPSDADDTFAFDTLPSHHHHHLEPEPEPESRAASAATTAAKSRTGTPASLAAFAAPSPTIASTARPLARTPSMQRSTRPHPISLGDGGDRDRLPTNNDDSLVFNTDRRRDANNYHHHHQNNNNNNNNNHHHRARNSHHDRILDRDRDPEHDGGRDRQQDHDHFMPRADRENASSDNTGGPGAHHEFALQGQRPRFLHNRYASTRSSTSSFVTNPDSHEDSEATVGLGVDYALHSGGALPTVGMPRAPTTLLPRTMSIGSLTSGTDEYPEPTTDLTTNQLEPLTELGGLDRTRDGGFLVRTPSPSKKTIAAAAPTDTVIAQHVKKVHVPESLAKEYKFKNGLETPRVSTSFNTAVAGTTGAKKTGRNLTLKEQSGTIERLSKENFDLKLKVMFLSDRLDKLSEEGIKEMIAENVELKTGLALSQRDNKLLRRRVKELQKQLKDESERPSTARSTTSSTDKTFQEEVQGREEELAFLRQRVEEYAEEIDRLHGESFSRESEKRKLADIVKVLGERTGDTLGRQEEADVWKDLLEQETARREQSDEDNRRLRDEIFRLKKEISGSGIMHHTTNIYNITKKPRDRDRDRDRLASPNRTTSELSGDVDGGLGGGGGGGGGSGSGGGLGFAGGGGGGSGGGSSHANYSAASTLVEELRRESEQLRHENAELRREVGAQTSMLTSRNREKERLYQEIEDLKMAQRRGGPGGVAPSTIDSLLERSASRSGVHHHHHHERPQSGGSTRARTVEEEAEREELENKMAELRDSLSEVKLRNQDLQRELENCMVDFEAAVNGKREAEEAMMSLQEELETATNDLIALQSERDEALRETAELENSFEILQGEAQEEVNALEGEIERLQADLNDRSENFESLQDEMRKMSEALLGLEDEQEHKLRHIQELEEEQQAKLHQIQHLEQELESSNKELEELEHKLIEANEKNERLAVQQESSQGEIAFLREEQEADKIRIGDLEAAFNNAEQAIQNEKDRVAELEGQLAEERLQWEAISKSKESDAQQIFNDLSRETAGAKDEVRRLRKSLSSREVEATEWKERLLELENNLREALGDLNGTRSSLLKSIARMQRELENTIRELDTSKASLMEKDRIIKQRDSLLESHALETRKVTELLEKERVTHRNTKSQFETFQKTHQHLTRTASTQDIRINELEATRGQDRRKIAILEQTARDQLLERNELLLLLWQRLSALCGREWANSNTLIDRQVVASVEVIATRLPGFSKNLLAAVKTIEDTLGTLHVKVKSVEKDLYRDYQALESSLDSRIKRLDRLETMVRTSATAGSMSPHDANRMARLEEAYRQLKVENATLKTTGDVRSRAAAVAAAATGTTGGHLSNGGGGSDGSAGGSPSPLVPRGPGDRDRERAARATTTTTTTTATTATATPQGGKLNGSISRPAALRGSSTSNIPVSASTSTRSGGMDLVDAASDGSSINNNNNNNNNNNSNGNGTSSHNDTRWLLRLRDLEYKLKMEREARNQDRQAARQRLGGLETENKDLREKVRRANSNLTE